MRRLISMLGRVYRWLHDALYWRTSYVSGRISLGREVYISPGSTISARNTTIGDHTRINGPIRIAGSQSVTVGKYCAIGADVTIISTNHSMCHANLQIFLHQRFGFAALVDDRGPVVIGHNVWIGDRAVILPGVHVGDGAVIGTSSVVTRDVPSFCIVAGVPADTLRKRFDEPMIRELAKIRWWDWPNERIAMNRAFFEADLRIVLPQELKCLIVDG